LSARSFVTGCVAVVEFGELMSFVMSQKAAIAPTTKTRIWVGLDRGVSSLRPLFVAVIELTEPS
jgi:hypothetical protein